MKRSMKSMKSAHAGGGLVLRRNLDLRSDRCPMTFLKVRLAFEPLEAGEIIRVHLADPQSIDNVPRSLEAEGYDVFGETRGADGTLEILVQKTHLVSQ